MMTANKPVNYTPEMTKPIVESYLAGQTVEAIADAQAAAEAAAAKKQAEAPAAPLKEAGSKLDKATSLGVPVIDEKTFRDRLA
jgi:NAD-dependent DNA ligase